MSSVRTALLWLLAVSGVAFAQITPGPALTSQQGTLANIPVACSLGQLYFATNQTAGANVYGCTVSGNPGTWTLEASGGGGTRDENLYSSVAAKNINGVGAAVWSCISNCGVPDVSLFVGSEAGAVLNLTSVTTPTAQDQFVLPGGYNNQTITVEMHYFTSTDTNTGHSGTWTLTAVCGVEIINPTFAAAGGAVSLPGIATSTQEAVVTTTFTPSGCAAGTRMAIKSTWSQGTLTYLGVVALRLHATF